MNPCRQFRTSKVGFKRIFISMIACLFAGAFLTGCPPPVVRVPVSAESVIKANESAREADLAFARKDHYAALIKYLEASKLNPNSEYIYNKLGIAYSQLKYYSDATAAFQRSIGLNPKYPYSYNNQGTVYFAKDEKRNAEKYFKKAISIDSNVASFHVNLGTLYFERKQFEKGLAEWRKGIAIDPAALGRSEGVSLAAATGRASMERNYFMARVFAAMGDAERAVDSLQQAVNSGFTDIEAVKKETDFDPIRQHARFIELMKTLETLAK